MSKCLFLTGSFLFYIILLTCSRNNFLPAGFNTNNTNQGSTADKGGLTANEIWYYINPGETHRFTLKIDSGYTYSFHFYTESSVRCVRQYLVKEGISDTLQIQTIENKPVALNPSSLSAFKGSTLCLEIHSHSSLYDQYYSIYYTKQKIDSIPSSSYLDTTFSGITARPIKALFSDTASSDHTFFDHINRKYRYRIPIDSFQMNNFSFQDTNQFISEISLLWAFVSRGNNAIIYKDTSTQPLYWRYWSNKSDSLDLIAGITYDVSSNYKYLLKIFGVLLDPLPRLEVAVTRKKFPPVKKDPFDDDTTSMKFLKKDTTYTLSIYNEIRDKFYFKTHGDSIYSFIITSIDSLPLEINLSPMSAGLSSFSRITGSKEIVFKPLANATVLGIEISSSIGFPTNYSIKMGNYSGNALSDSFEPDDGFENASLLTQASVYRHTIFPMNDIDVFKVYCKGNDTFKLYIDFKDSALLKNHTAFNLNPLFNFEQNEIKIHSLSIHDSSSYKIFTWFRQVADTALFVAKDNQYLDYSISLRRKNKP